jgi:predicted GIY-YIG superfamily endonuclease
MTTMASRSLPALRPQPYHVYAIQCRDGSVYIGHTEDLAQRWADHLAGRVRWTRPRRPLTLVYREEHRTREMAVERERYLKMGCGREWLKTHLSRSTGGQDRLPAGRQVGTGVITEILK